MTKCTVALRFGVGSLMLYRRVPSRVLSIHFFSDTFAIVLAAFLYVSHSRVCFEERNGDFRLFPR